jgi:hypothetical protein
MRAPTRSSILGWALLVAGCGGSTTPASDETTDAAVVRPSAPAVSALAAPLWSKRLGPGSSNAASFDPSGDLAVTGEVFGAFDPSVGSEALPDADTSCASPSGFCYPDGFLALFDLQGKTLWTKRWIDAPVGGLAIGPGGLISVGLSASSQADGGASNEVATFDSTGSAVWTWSAPPAAPVRWLGVDASDNVFVFTQDAHLTKLDPTGSSIWSETLGSLVLNEGNAISLAVTPSGGVIAFGHLFVAGPDAASPPTDGRVPPSILTAFGSAGDLLWSRTLMGTGALDVGAVTVDAAGNVVVGGGFSNSLDLGGSAPLAGPTGTAEAIFVAKYDATGVFEWSRAYGGVGVTPGGGGPRDVVGAVAPFASNDFLVLGTFGGAIDFGAGAYATNGNGATDIFLAELDGNGNAVTTNRFGDGEAIFDTASSIAVSSQGVIAAVGSFQSTVDFGEGPFASPYDGPCQFGPCSDAFVAAFGP